MSRPKPNVIMELVNRSSFKAEQVLEADAIYSVFYQGRPINLRTTHKLTNYPGPKYKKVSFSNPGHAFNLADRLNRSFQTQDFTVVRLTIGEVVLEHECIDHGPDSQHE